MKIDQRIADIIARADVLENTLTLPPKLDRADYLAVDKILKAIGGKWNRGAQAHFFDSDPTPMIEQAIATLDVTRPQDFGFFETPEPLIERMLDLAGIGIPTARRENPNDRQTVLEPNAGRGRIVKAVIARAAHVWACELLEENANHVDAIFKGPLCLRADFLTIKPDDSMKFDAAVMNPPFARQDDIKHVMHAFQFLRAGGTLVSVMSAGAMFRENGLAKSFRAFVAGRGGSMERLPPQTFRESGTDVNTCLVVIR